MSNGHLPVVVVIGNGMVGHRFCEKLRVSGQFRIVVFGEEPRPAYDRVHLSEYFNGKSASDLALPMKGWFDEEEIVLHLGHQIREIDRQQKLVHSDKGVIQRYDYLVLATGSSPFVPDIPGVEKEGVFVYRTIEEAGRDCRVVPAGGVCIYALGHNPERLLVKPAGCGGNSGRSC